SFILIELRHKAPLVRLSIFRIRSLSTANITMFLVASGMFAMFFFNTLYIQRVLGYGPLKAGLAFLPFTAGIMVSAGLASTFATIAASKTTDANDPASLVTGFHWAYACGAVIVAIALVAYLSLLRREDVEKIEAAAADPVMVNV